MPAGILDKNRKALELLNRTQPGPFTAKDASSTLKLPLKKTSILLTYLVMHEWLSRVKRGVYVVVPLGIENPKEYRANPLVVADKVFAPCYIGGFSAAEHWGLTEQIFNTVVIFSTHRPQRKNMSIQGTDFIIKYINEEHLGETTSIWIDNNKIQISTPAQTTADMLDDPSIGGGIRNVTDITKEYLSSQLRNDKDLLTCISKKNNRTIYKRLGFIIEACELDAVAVKETCKNNISSGYSLLDPSSEAEGPFNSKWQLQINVRVTR